ncbi:hypothetical protein GOODEAATRI_001056 [Goodea atripinnis]|uniref:Pericentriolar material 1 protein C-terminal domain-containing protein n=1 Tax=Goodea atripinnis TaxID=208336 RepID=A0ABV0PAI8_9TELE
MAEQQRRNGLCDSPCQMEDQEGSATLSQSVNRDERIACTEAPVTKHLAVRRAAEDQLPPLGSVVWTAGSQSELTPSQSLVTSDEVSENMNEVCSHQLLTSVRRMVLTLSQQHDESKEFVRFFHKQLGGILQVGLVAASCNSSHTVEERTLVEHQNPEEEREVGASAAEGSSETSQDVPNESSTSTSTSPNTDSPVLVSVDVSLSSKRIVEEQQNNNLSVEILNGNAELLTGLVGSAQALKEPGQQLLRNQLKLVCFVSGSAEPSSVKIPKLAHCRCWEDHQGMHGFGQSRMYDSSLPSDTCISVV